MKAPRSSILPDRPMGSTLASVRKHESVLDPKGRFFDPRHGAISVKILPGEHYVTGNPDEMLVTVLGSCIAACIRNPETGFGGMNHFMLPECNGKLWGGAEGALRYGNHAMETLINDVLAQGCARRDLEIKLFGAADVLQNIRPVGPENVEFVEHYLHNEGLSIAAKDLGGTDARRIHYFPVNGKVKRMILTRKDDHLVFNEENDYRSHIHVEEESGGIELFGDD